MTAAATLERPADWRWLYDAREAGMVPKNRTVRIGLDGELWGGALHIPADIRTDAIDYSLVAGLDVLLFIDVATAYNRLGDCCAGLLAAGAESLRVLTPGQAVATLRVGHDEFRGGHLRDQKEAMREACRAISRASGS